jgi:CDP-diglyceride synthetase
LGSLIGKNKMSVQLSPNKTWEGFIGGILLRLINFKILINLNYNFLIFFKVFLQPLDYIQFKINVIYN